MVSWHDIPKQRRWLELRRVSNRFALYPHCCLECASRLRLSMRQLEHEVEHWDGCCCGAKKRVKRARREVTCFDMVHNKKRPPHTSSLRLFMYWFDVHPSELLLHDLQERRSLMPRAPAGSLEPRTQLGAAESVAALPWYTHRCHLLRGP